MIMVLNYEDGAKLGCERVWGSFAITGNTYKCSTMPQNEKFPNLENGAFSGTKCPIIIDFFTTENYT